VVELVVHLFTAEVTQPKVMAVQVVVLPVTLHIQVSTQLARKHHNLKLLHLPRYQEVNLAEMAL
jgi:hypothetical protein